MVWYGGFGWSDFLADKMGDSPCAAHSRPTENIRLGDWDGGGLPCTAWRCEEVVVDAYSNVDVRGVDVAAVVVDVVPKEQYRWTTEKDLGFAT